MNEIERLIDLSGRVAIVAGGATGQGRSTAQVLSAAGAKIVIGDINEEGSAETVRLVQDAAGEIISVRTDVAVRLEVEGLVERAISEFGQVDIMANMVGVPFEKQLLETTEEELDRILAVNLKGMYFGCQAAMKPMMERRSGSIVNITSGIIDGNGSPYVAYGISKVGIVMLTKILAKEAAQHKIRVNCIAPGLIDTPFLDRMFAQGGGTVDGLTQENYMERVRGGVPLGILGKPEHIAHAILWLCSDAAEFMTGQIVRPNGGGSMPW